MRILNWLATSLLVATLVACGGGGGSAGVSGASGSAASGSAGGATPTVVVSVVKADGLPATSVQVGGGFSAKAVLRDKSGLPVANRLVTFTVDGSVATLGALTALSNSSGEASVPIGPSSISASGATTVRASADVEGTTYSSQFDFAVSAGSVSLSSIRAAATALPSAGNTSLEVTALVAGVPTSLPVNVRWTASCGLINEQNSQPDGVGVSTNGSGVALASYRAVDASGQLCRGAVTVTANTAGAPASSGFTLNIQAPVPNSIAFINATPNNIFVAGSGANGRSEVKFRVVSSTGSALQGVAVRLSIVDNPGGVGIVASGSLAPVEILSDSAGDVVVSVFSGNRPGPVKLRASLVSDASIFSESQNLSVASGPASQRFMDLAVSTFNIEGWSRSGSNTQLSVRVADRQGNAVEDGTVINFTSEGGQVASSCTTTRNAGISSCAVDLISQNPRPSGGRVSVLAYLEGEKDYVDVDGSNSFTPGDTLIEMGDAFRDDNENNIYDSNIDRFVFPRGGNVACAGSGGASPSQANTCDGKLRTTVRAQTIILFSSSQPQFSNITLNTFDVTSTVTVGTTTSVVTRTFAASFSIDVRSLDNFLLPMPAGTIVSAEALGTVCKVEKQFGSPVVNTISTSGNPTQDLSTRFSASLTDCELGRSTLVVNVTSPSGLRTATSFALN